MGYARFTEKQDRTSLFYYALIYETHENSWLGRSLEHLRGVTIHVSTIQGGCH